MVYLYDRSIMYHNCHHKTFVIIYVLLLFKNGVIFQGRSISSRPIIQRSLHRTSENRHLYWKREAWNVVRLLPLITVIRFWPGVCLEHNCNFLWELPTIIERLVCLLQLSVTTEISATFTSSCPKAERRQNRSWTRHISLFRCSTFFPGMIRM